MRCKLIIYNKEFLVKNTSSLEMRRITCTNFPHLLKIDELTIIKILYPGRKLIMQQKQTEGVWYLFHLNHFSEKERLLNSQC